MKIPRSQHLANERGAALVTALLVMVILTIMGTVAMTIRNTEQSIVLNSEVFQHNFYSLEGVTLEAAHVLDNLDDECLLNYSDPSCPASLNWLKVYDSGNAALNMKLQTNWPSGSILPAATSLNTDPTRIIPPGYNDTGASTGDRVWYAVLDQGLCSTGSRRVGAPEERCYDIYGMYDIKRGAGKAYTGRMMLQIGYQQMVYSTP
jgi:hypothetical protein